MKKARRDTITALSSPEGEGAIAVIRLSGPLSHPILSRIFSPLSGLTVSGFKPHRIYRGWVCNGKEEVDQAMAALMKGPRSFTGEDMAEIFTHGGPAVVSAVLDLIIGLGARLAEPGEFSRRAFLNGKLSLAEAESIAWIVAAQSKAELRAAARQLKGGPSLLLGRVKKRLIEALSLLELTLDFDDYAEEEPDREKIAGLLKSARRDAGKLLEESRSGSYLRDGVKVVIIGKPNVGKSSLLNKFLDQKRAIVSKEPGTTRDTIEEVIRLDGIPLKIIDTAGIRSPHGEIEKEGVSRTVERVKEADLVLMVLDSGTELSKDDYRALELAGGKRSLLIVNKTDLPSRVNLKEISHNLNGSKAIEISATRNWGLQRLKEEVLKAVRKEFLPEASRSAMISRKRRIALKTAVLALDNALLSLKKGLSGEFCVLDLREALREINLVFGEEPRDDILDEIFSNFCIGK